jgi:hypothetical protein
VSRAPPSSQEGLDWWRGGAGPLSGYIKALARVARCREGNSGSSGLSCERRLLVLA